MAAPLLEHAYKAVSQLPQAYTYRQKADAHSRKFSTLLASMVPDSAPTCHARLQKLQHMRCGDILSNAVAGLSDALNAKLRQADTAMVSASIQLGTALFKVSEMAAARVKALDPVQLFPLLPGATQGLLQAHAAVFGGAGQGRPQLQHHLLSQERLEEVRQRLVGAACALGVPQHAADAACAPMLQVAGLGVADMDLSDDTSTGAQTAPTAAGAARSSSEAALKVCVCVWRCVA